MTDGNVTDLIADLRNKNPRKRQSAAKCLGHFRNPQAVPALVALLKSQDQEGHWFPSLKAAASLGMIRDPDAVPALIEALSYENLSLVRESAQALVQIGLPAVPALIEVLKDENMREEAARALRQIDPTAFFTEMAHKNEELNHTAHHDDAPLRIQLGPAAVPDLIQTFKGRHQALQVRREAARALEAIGSPAVPGLIEAFQDPDRDWLIRLDTLQMLGVIGDAQAIPAFIQALKNEDAATRRVTALALMEYARHHPHPALRTAMPALSLLQSLDSFTGHSQNPIFEDAWNFVDAATKTLQDLPRSAAAPPLDAKTLPRPMIDAETLPDASMSPPQGLWARLRRALKGS